MWAIRDLVTGVFRRAQADVAAASCVRDGVAASTTFSPDIVVCDLAMRDEDGYAFLRAIRALPQPASDTASDTPIIALTAFGHPDDSRHALAAGFDDYLKTHRPAELTATALRFTALGEH